MINFKTFIAFRVVFKQSASSFFDFQFNSNILNSSHNLNRTLQINWWITARGLTIHLCNLTLMSLLNLMKICKSPCRLHLYIYFNYGKCTSPASKPIEAWLRAERGGKLSLVSPSCPSSLLCLGPALSVFLSLFLCISVASVCECHSVCCPLPFPFKKFSFILSLLFFFSFSSSILLISACHLFLSAFLSTMRLVYLLQFNWLCYPAALHLHLLMLLLWCIPSFFPYNFSCFFQLFHNLLVSLNSFPLSLIYFFGVSTLPPKSCQLLRSISHWFSLSSRLIDMRL